MLDVLQQCIKEFYLTFADNSALIDFTRYLKFVQNFDIYPTMTSKGMLHGIFYALAER